MVNSGVESDMIYILPEGVSDLTILHLSRCL